MKKQKFLLLLTILLVSLLLIVTNYYTIKVLSAVRAYINGESEYSKGQKDATLYLVTYVESENIAYWHAFKKAIAVPKGDNIARNSMLANKEDEIAKQGFLTGRNNISDIPNMIWLFKTFNNVSFMKRAIDIWASAEPLINKLDTIGENIHLQIQGEKLSADARLNNVKEINYISSQLSEKESAFSNALGETARDINGYLLFVNIFLILLLLSVIAVFTVKMLNNQIAAEKALTAKNTELNATNKELEQFTYAASHDLQEPLRMVSAYMGLLQKRYDGQLDEKAQSYIHYAVDGANRMKVLINDLLEYSRTSSSTVAYSDVLVTGVLEDIQKTFREDLQEPGAGIFFSELPTIKANKMQMLQLFQNLVGNAIKYRNEAAPQIHISATTTNTHWIFSVKDNGQGIDPKYYEKIFGMFQRLHSNTTHKGTGIGLALCKKIAERHGGDIWLTSEPGRGSNFFFSVAKPA
ncbi:sensor histidine kinase [Lacibacter sp. H407]|uniref:sensor histidine kinase n=1 Tax=Lacibacter sp. H407 TaxID=3133423 RepID=UPI0030BB04F3